MLDIRQRTYTKSPTYIEAMKEKNVYYVGDVEHGLILHHPVDAYSSRPIGNGSHRRKDMSGRDMHGRYNKYTPLNVSR